MVDGRILGFQEGYNARLRRLIAERGLPANSLQRYLIEPKALYVWLKRSDLRLLPGDRVSHADGRRVERDGAHVRAFTTGGDRICEEEVWSYRDEVTIVRGPDPQQVLIGSWENGRLERLLNARAGVLLQAVGVCRKRGKYCNWPESPALHLHD